MEKEKIKEELLEWMRFVVKVLENMDTSTEKEVVSETSAAASTADAAAATGAERFSVSGALRPQAVEDAAEDNQSSGGTATGSHCARQRRFFR